MLVINNFTCYQYTDRVKMFDCNFIKFTTNRFGFSARTMFNRNMDRNLRCHIDLDLLPRSSRQIIHIVDVRFNMCSLLSQVNNKLVASLLKEFKRVTNLPKSCPYKKVWFGRKLWYHPFRFPCFFPGLCVRGEQFYIDG